MAKELSMSKGAILCRARRAEFKRKGLCDSCAKGSAVKGKTLCWACLEKHNKRTASSKAKLNSQGLCVFCGKEPARGGCKKGGSRLCTECGIRVKKRRQEREGYIARVLGLCYRCKKHKPTCGWRMCSECLAKSNASTKKTHDKYRRDGKCIHCGQKLTEWDVSLKTRRQLVSCNDCREKNILRKGMRI